ncbi:MAG: LysR family transcriptional regulator, partial [Pseudobdellovibrionaceae bacterium]
MTHKTNFSLTQIEYVVAVYKTGHFAKAADLCGVTQPTLSMQIKKLEDDLGVTLFDRSKKPILLTKTGQAVLEQLQTLLYEAKKVSSIIENSESKGVQGVLTVGIIPTISPYLLPLLLPVLSKKYPGLKLQIKEMHTQKIIDALETDDIDVGCLATPLGVAQIHEYPLYYEPFYVLCRQDHEWAPLKKIKE